MNYEENQNELKDPIVFLKQPFRDKRGIIQPLVSLEEPKIRSAVWIESEKESVRGNHYHKTDWHYCYVVSGSIEYYYRPANSKKQPKKTLINAGQLFYTPPMVEHAMVFPEDTVFLTLSGGTRLQEDYESDVVRVEVV